MNPLDTAVIRSWHAHVYFDAPRRETAWALREAIGTALAGRMELGRFHEQPVGPHPMGSYQPAFASAQFAAVVACPDCPATGASSSTGSATRTATR